MKQPLIKSYLSIGLLTIFSTLISGIHVHAETTIERIDRTGVIRAGARKNAKPFGYIDQQGNWVGYGIDIMTVVKSQLEKALKKNLKLELVETNTENRFDFIRENKVDIACGPDSFTWNREKFVDFSLSYFVTGTQFLVPKGTQLNSLRDLRSYQIGVEPKTTNEAILKVLDSRLNLIPISDRNNILTKLENREIQVYAGDGVLLEAIRAKANNSQDWEIIPEDDLINRESYACLLPENDSRWRDLVNYSILRAIQGYLIEDPEFTSMFEDWFGENGVLPYSQEVLKEHFQGIVDTVERIPKTAY